MAEDNTTPNTDNIQGDQLSDLTKLLLGAGSAGVGTYLGAKSNLNVGDMKNTNSIFLSPTMFNKLGGARSMHPAFASKLGYKGPLDTAAAVSRQTDADREIFGNIEKYKRDPSQLDYLSGFGWGAGPFTGIGREVPDVGMSLKHTVHPDAGEMYTLTHPGGDVHRKFNMEIYPSRRLLEREGTPAYVESNKGFHDIHIDEDLFKDWPGNVNRLRRQYPPDRYPNLARTPWEQYEMPALAHELQHVGQQGWFNPSLAHNDRPQEWEARAVEHSLLHPDPSYLIPFHIRSQSQNYDYNQYLNNIKLFSLLRGRNG